MAIVALLFSIVALSTGTTVDDRLEVEAKRLLLLMEYASEDALLTGIEVGARVDEEKYQFYRLTAEGWQQYPGSHPLRARQLPRGVTIRRLDEPRGPEKNSSKSEEEKAEERPELLFLSTGEVSPFDLEISAQGYTPVFRVQASIDGQIRLRRPGDLYDDARDAAFPE